MVPQLNNEGNNANSNSSSSNNNNNNNSTSSHSTTTANNNNNNNNKWVKFPKLGVIDAIIDEEESAVHLPTTTTTKSSSPLKVRHTSNDEVEVTQYAEEASLATFDSDVGGGRHPGYSICPITGAQKGPNPRDMMKTDAARMASLGSVTALYDRNHKGYLDPTETLLRRMDSKNQGYLDNAKVYDIFSSLQKEQVRSAELIQSLQKEHQKTMSLKRGIFYMGMFAFLLALSNIGTSFAAARMAKDVTISQEDLVDKQTGMRVATTSKNVVLRINPTLDLEDKSSSTTADASTTTDPGATRRFLQQAVVEGCSQPYQADYTNTEWTTESANVTTVSCLAIGRVDYDDAEALYRVFCPEYISGGANAGFTNPGLCSNVGLPEILLQCGTRMTRILGGVHFPMAGTPGLSDTGSHMIFPTPSVDQSNIPAPQYYFIGYQLIDEPRPQFSLTQTASTGRCEELIQFKLYCDPTRTMGCAVLATFPTGTSASRRCSGDIMMCGNGPTTPVVPSSRTMLRDSKSSLSSTNRNSGTTGTRGTRRHVG